MEGWEVGVCSSYRMHYISPGYAALLPKQLLGNAHGSSYAMPVQLCAIFLIFMGITVSWEGLVGLLTFLNNVLRGRKADWLHRVKEELLALGVVSLVLLFLEVSNLELATTSFLAV